MIEGRSKDDIIWDELQHQEGIEKKITFWSFVVVVKPWSLVNANYFSSTQTVALTVFGITAGALMRYLHRYKVRQPLPMRPETS